MKITSTLAIACLLLSSCATYHLTTQSLLEQCATSPKQTKVNLLIAPPFVFFPGIVDGNSLTQLYCLDKNENEVMLPVTTHMGMRITQKDGKHTTFYFDTLLLKDSTVTGSKSHFIVMKINPIKLANISKIEVQK